MTPKELRAAGEKLGREKLAQRAIEIMTEALADGSYKEAITAVGKMKVLYQMCGYDEYWKEKADIGVHKEEHRIYHLDL